MILATDYDGTLSRGGISDGDRQAIIRFREEGNLYGVVTGRDFGGIYHTLSGEHGVPFDFIILMNGAIAVDRNGDILYERSADGCILPELIQTVKDICSHPTGCATGKTRYEFNADLPEGDEKFAPLTLAGKVREFTMANTRCATEDEAAHAVKILRERFGSYVNPLQNGVCIDIPPVGVDKGTGVADYAALMDVPHDKIWTAGDNYNDLAMLTCFHGCAMVNGVQAVKEVSKGVYPDIASIVDDMLAGEQ